MKTKQKLMSKIFKVIIPFEYDTSEEQWKHIKTKQDAIKEAQFEIHTFPSSDFYMEVEELEVNDTDND